MGNKPLSPQEEEKHKDPLEYYGTVKREIVNPLRNCIFKKEFEENEHLILYFVKMPDDYSDNNCIVLHDKKNNITVRQHHDGNGFYPRVRTMRSLVSHDKKNLLTYDQMKMMCELDGNMLAAKWANVLGDVEKFLA